MQLKKKEKQGLEEGKGLTKLDLTAFLEIFFGLK